METNEEELASILSSEGFSEEEIEEVNRNAAEYGHVLRDIVEEKKKILRNTAQLNSLHGEYATHNYEIYENYMEVHANAISMSAMKAEIALMHLPLPHEYEDKIQNILEEYLLISGFY
jgi:hypothetical protein